MFFSTSVYACIDKNKRMRDAFFIAMIFSTHLIFFYYFSRLLPENYFRSSFFQNLDEYF